VDSSSQWYYAIDLHRFAAMRSLAILFWASCGFSSSLTPSDGVVPGGEPMMMIDAPKPDGTPGTARKRRITIPEAKVFGDVTAFPVWFVIDDAAGLGAKATTTGDDIYLTKPDGSPLEFQRIAWNKSNGHFAAWVRIDLTDAAGGEFDLRFGDPGPAHSPNPLLTFSANFQAVWHMDTLATTTVTDARGVVNGTAVNGPAAIDGKIAGGIDFDGTNDEVTFTNPITGNASATISAWVKVSLPAAGFSSIMTVGNPATNQSRFFHTNYMGLAYGFFGNDIQTSMDIHNNQFTLLHWTYDGNTKQASLYRDGVQVGTTTTIAGTIATSGTAGHIATAPMQWGPGGNTTNPVNGILDEVRIASVARSLGWVKTEFANQNDPVTFFMVGPDVSAP
jgi:hypothetical protein